MKTIRLFAPGLNDNAQKILRQTPGGKGFWKDNQFYINEGDEPYDYLVLFANYPQIIRTTVPKERRIFIAGEPPQMKHYPDSFLAQFGTVISSHESIQHPNSLIQQQGYIWFAGIRFNENNTRTVIRTYDEYMREAPILKTKTLSVVCSNKCSKPGHKKRYEFVQKLKERLGDELDVFGKGQNPVANKSDAIRPYKYHITIENGSAPHYWSEKLADCYLDEAYPLYAGCPEINQYFSEQAYTRIDLDDIDSSIERIHSAIQEDRHLKARPAIRASKKLVLNDYNIFNLISEQVQRMNTDSIQSSIKTQKLYPRQWFQKGLKTQIKLLWTTLRP